MGFFSPGKSKNRYVGMWYKNISVRTVVWVANREAPLRSRNGMLKVIEPGILVLLNDTNNVVWSTNTSRSVQNPVAELLDSGNLVVKQSGHGVSDGNFLWQSFDHPTNTLLPGMKLGWNFVTGREVYLSSWKNEDDPTPGDYSYHCDPSGYPQNILKKGSNVIYRSGVWNSLRFGGARNSRDSTFYRYGIFSSKTEVYFGYNLTSSVIATFILSQNGVAQLLTWGDGEQGWVPYLVIPGDNCDTYKLCGSYGSCNNNDFPVLCGCLDKFVPNNSKDWNKADWSGGCVRRTELNCLQGDVFLKYSQIKLPDTRNCWSNVTMTLEECKNICSKNCSCMAYSNADIHNGGSGCLLWFKDLLDIRQVPKGGLDIYVKVAASESGLLADDKLEKSNGKLGKSPTCILASSVGVIFVILSLLIYNRIRKKDLELKTKGKLEQSGNYKMDFNRGNCAEEFEIPLFDLSTIAKATNNFSIDRKIGEGGFGPVYKGILEGQEIAVKRLSRTSTQGENEFKNEVIILLNFSIGICIARGVMYLHQDSQLRIIHRDLKANNILLDKDMNPKISDFGLAKICEEDDIGAQTNRVIGTYGYLSPEYALHGLYSVKSDVFSFGILVLEIAWKIYKEGRSMELLDERLSDSCSRSEVVRSICVGLLCVQQCPEDRPSMSSVVVMLNNEGVLPQAKQPDTISNDSPIKDGHTIVSAGGNFELGFFSPGNSKNRYIGIWYNNLPKGREVVWVANRVNPLNDTSGILTVSSKGIVLLNGNQDVIWSSNSSKRLMNPVAQLLDTGNLVLKDDSLVNLKDYAWQSFDYPDSTLLPGMKLGLNLVTGKYWTMSSWKSSDDPSPGEYLDRLDTSGYPQFFVWEGPAIQFSSGIWNGHLFVGGPNLKPNPYYTFEFVNNDKEIYYKYELINTSLPTRLVLNPAGLLQRLLWIERNQNWFLYSTGQMDNCDRYALCGQFARCNINDSPPCDCLRGFQPKNQQEWDAADWSSGCVRRTPLTCGTNDRFLKYSSVKLPDTRHSWFDKSIGLEECQRLCLKNCSCTAYSNLDVKNGGSGCLLWFNELVDIREYAELDQDLYVRMAASELGSDYMGNTRMSVIAIILTVSAIILVGFLFWFAMQRKKGERGVGEGEGKEDMELPLFDVMTVSAATNNFSSDNIIGEGGFGSVYRGKLSTGPEIAVKKLSKHSGQGFEELKNEVVLISKLQHRNLVRLLGCCLEGEERMLIYEYMPNNSLDFFIFDECRKKQLPWENRFRIAMGISRGILYLHQDSRLRIIHRDLKTSNILLDSELNPKISDFGLARIIGGDQNEARTKRVIGTYGYMSPEYAVDGKFSVKSDVFSLGVLLLEIVSGRKNRTFHHPDHHHSLIGHAWLLWNKGKALELIDDCLKESFVESQVLRCVHVALLCVQRLTDERPTMSSVVFMLSHEEVALPQPKEPGFFIERSTAETDDSNEKRCISDNVLTLTILQPR
ncbi:hypothetical protein MTR67_033180 [Solanum verrucosum]|uniref:non-specific serine/threonine protein kinase n=1 Tax=Solanum verrucosum TaxID=315347 RepID=A0AAF0U5V3_SOLVR|nr:hypothetical protein MTR67_033180 [Solanum verrucosum]